MADAKEQTPLRLWLDTIEEPDLRILVRDLLITMGYEQVSITHGSLEFGRDLIFLETDRLGRHVWRGVQVKAQSISGSMTESGLRTLINQCETALDTPVPLSSGASVMLEEIWILNSRQLTEQAKQSVLGKTSVSKRITIIDGPKLHDLVQEHMPHLMAQRSSPIEYYIHHLKEYCDTPEDYLTARFGARIPLSRCFIPPQGHLRVLTPSSPKFHGDASRASGLADFSVDAAAYVNLARKGRVPYVWQLRAAALLLRLKRFQLACQSTPQGDAELSTFSRLIEELARLLGATVQEDVVLRADLSDAITPQFLEREAGEYLRSIAEQYNDLAIISVTREEIRERLQKRGISGGLLDVMISDRVNLYAKAYEKLATAYKRGSVASDPFVQVSHLIATRLAASESASEESSQVARVSNELAGLIRSLQSNLEHAYEEQLEVMPSLIPGRIPLANAQVGAAIRLSQITHALEAVFDFEDDDVARLGAPALNLLNQAERVVLIGDLGHGKSTTLKRLGHHAAGAHSGDGKTKLIPIITELGALQDDGSSMRTRLLASARHSFPGLERLADDGILWLLDGYDEMSSVRGRRELLNWIATDGVHSPKHVLLTSRPSAFVEYVPNLSRVYLDPFGPAEVAAFLDKFPWTDASAKSTLTAALAEAPEFSELAASPMLLTLLALLTDAQRQRPLPHRRESIYERIVNLFLGDWDRAKGIERNYVIPEQPDRVLVLARAAFDLYEARKRTFSRDEFVATMARRLPFDCLNDHDIANACLDELVRDSMIIEQPNGHVAFFHLSIHEYLAAVEMARDFNQKRTWNAVTEYFRNGWWEEVLVFYAGIKRDITPLIPELHNHIVRTNADDARLVRLLTRWLTVADFTNLLELNPKSTVAATFALLDVAGAAVKWRKHAVSLS